LLGHHVSSIDVALALRPTTPAGSPGGPIHHSRIDAQALEETRHFVKCWPILIILSLFEPEIISAVT